MNDNVLKDIAMKSTGLLITVIIIMVVCTHHQNNLIYAKNIAAKSLLHTELEDLYLSSTDFTLDKTFRRSVGLSGSEDEYQGNVSSIKTVKLDHLAYQYLKIDKKGISKNVEFTLEDLYMSHSIRLKLYGIEDKNYTTESVKSNSVLNQEDFLKNVEIFYDYNEDKENYNITMEFEFDQIYVHKLYQDDDFFYVELLKPREVYDKILVVDAGHGGNDIGTYSPNMQYFEKDLNLAMVLELKKLLDQENIKVYYTRLDDDKLYLNQRVNLANELNADLFISIHCNASENLDANGTEVLYDQMAEEKDMNSKELATICLNELVNIIGTRERGIVESNDTYIIGHSKVPVALIEVGYMSNPNELDFLIQEENQKMIAQGIYNGIMKAFSKIEQK